VRESVPNDFFSSLLAGKYGGRSCGPGGEERGAEFWGQRFAVTVGEVRADAAGFRIYDPNLLGAVGEVQLDFQVKLGGGVGIRRDFDGKGGRVFIVFVGIAPLHLRGPDKKLTSGCRQDWDDSLNPAWMCTSPSSRSRT